MSDLPESESPLEPDPKDQLILSLVGMLVLVVILATILTAIWGCSGPPGPQPPEMKPFLPVEGPLPEESTWRERSYWGNWA